LEDDDQQVRRLIARLAHDTWETALAAPSPAGRARFDRMQHPQVGDLVVEVSAWLPHRVDVDYVCKGVGYLLAVRDEQVWTDEAITEALADPADFTDEDRQITSRVWYVQYGPAPVDVCRWENADFIAVDLGSMILARIGVGREPHETP
jgi:hypothetical protein